MITSEDTSNILYKICNDKFDLSVYQEGCTPEGEVTEPRIVIVGCELKEDTYWLKGTLEVKFIVPKINEKKDKETLDEYSHQAKERLEKGILYIGDDTLKYSYVSSSIKEDSQLRCHFVNVLIEIKVLNIN